jgi:hypothetical protein
MIKKYIVFHVKYPFFLSDLNETWIFFDGHSKDILVSNFMKIHPDGAELFHADGQIDMMSLIVTLRNLRTRLNMEHKFYGN